MESPKIHLQSRCYSRHTLCTQCPAWISYLLLEGVEVGLIGPASSTSHPDILPLAGARSCDCQYGGWWSREAGRQLEVASVSSSTNSARERKPRGKASRPLKRARCRSRPNHETNLAWDCFSVFGKDETDRCQHLFSLLSANTSFYDFEALMILYEISQFIIFEHLFSFLIFGFTS